MKTHQATINKLEELLNVYQGDIKRKCLSVELLGAINALYWVLDKNDNLLGSLLSNIKTSNEVLK